MNLFISKNQFDLVYADSCNLYVIFPGNHLDSNEKSKFYPWLLSWDWQVGLWWISITIISLLNIYIWWRTYQWFQKESPNWFPKDQTYVKIQLYLSAGYV
jgi:hypothetical protein